MLLIYFYLIFYFLYFLFVNILLNLNILYFFNCFINMLKFWIYFLFYLSHYMFWYFLAFKFSNFTFIVETLLVLWVLLITIIDNYKFYIIFTFLCRFKFQTFCCFFINIFNNWYFKFFFLFNNCFFLYIHIFYLLNRFFISR